MKITNEISENLPLKNIKINFPELHRRIFYKNTEIYLFFSQFEF